MNENLLWILLIFSGFIVVYHHFLYPCLLFAISSLKKNHSTLIERSDVLYAENPEKDGRLPTITIVVPIRNEARYILQKLNNLSSLDYPHSHLKIVLLCDGCEDNSVPLIENWLKTNHPLKDFSLIIFSEHQGKIALLNNAIKECETDLIAFSDASAILSTDSLLIAANHFTDPKVGVVGGTYQLLSSNNPAEIIYWKYQATLKQHEAVLGSPMGAHGSGYITRTSVTELIEPDTINDDLILPLQIVAKGYRFIYEPKIICYELDPSSKQVDLERRKRISAGNWQQIYRLRQLLHPRFGGISFNFISGKVLRTFIPFFLIIIFLTSLSLCFTHKKMAIFVSLQLLFYSIAICVHLFSSLNKYKLFSAIHYFVYGHLMTLIGFYRYMMGYYNSAWHRVSFNNSGQYIHPAVTFFKWIFDIIASLIGLTLTTFLLPVIALLIKIDSPGPVFHTQLRVGRQWPDRTEIIKIYKFRTMIVNAEKKEEAVWATKNDPRITRVGKFLRKTRIDELPQLLNVLMGDMSLSGPRPERPKFYAKLEKEIPFYSERVYGVRPGITGLAQVLIGYDQSIEDVKSKVAFDHAYALSLVSPWEWVRMECYILAMTIKVILFGKGH